MRLFSLFPNCREASRLQSEVLDRPLTAGERLGLRLHLLACRWCRRYGRQLRFLHQAAGEHPDRLAGSGLASLSPEARERLKNALRRYDP